MTAHNELKTAWYGKLTGVSTFDTNLSGGLINITGATGTSTITVTATAHGLTAGELATIASVGGMTDINGLYEVQSVPTANTFTITQTTSQTYTSGGTSHRNAVFYRQAPQNAVYPYVVFSFFADNYSHDSGNKWEEVFIQTDIYDSDSSSGDIGTLESNAIDLLETTLTLTNYTQIDLKRQSKRYLYTDEDVYRTLIEHRIELEHN